MLKAVLLLPLFLASTYAADGDPHPMNIVVKPGIWLNNMKGDRFDGPSSFTYAIVEGAPAMTWTYVPHKADGSSATCRITYKPNHKFTQVSGATVTFQPEKPEASFNDGAAFEVKCDEWKKV